jgi:hypothetical protein
MIDTSEVNNPFALVEGPIICHSCESRNPGALSLRVLSAWEGLGNLTVAVLSLPKDESERHLWMLQRTIFDSESLIAADPVVFVASNPAAVTWLSQIARWLAGSPKG